MATRAFKKTRYEYVQGKLSWPKLVIPDQMYNCWIVTIHPTPESLDKIRDLQAEGLKNVIKKDEDGYHTKFRCPVSRSRKDGSVWAFKQPDVVDKDGLPIDGNTIGNGSDGTLKLEVYGHLTPGGGQAIAARLVGVRVDNLVPFSSESMDEEFKKNTEGLMRQPPLF